MRLLNLTTRGLSLTSSRNLTAGSAAERALSPEQWALATLLGEA
ncbi:hypothetical protein [Cystobacter fuscus]|nr:hypothetical protein [Cystobacter fuscus]